MLRQLWCNLGISVRSQTCDIFSFLFNWSAHLERYILLKTPPELDQWFQSYEQLKDSQNINRKQKKIHFFFWLYLTNNAPNVWLFVLNHNTNFMWHMVKKIKALLKGGELLFVMSSYAKLELWNYNNSWCTHVELCTKNFTSLISMLWHCNWACYM